MIVLTSVGLFLAGVLAGEEFIVRYGVQPALAALDDEAHLRARQALIRRLMVLVPSIMIPTVIVGILVAVLGGGGPGCYLRIAGAVALVGFLIASFAGTVPINIKVNDWDPAAPPADWRTVITRWKRIDVIRSSFALLAFACFVVAVALQTVA